MSKLKVTGLETQHTLGRVSSTVIQVIIVVSNFLVGGLAAVLFKGSLLPSGPMPHHATLVTVVSWLFKYGMFLPL